MALVLGIESTCDETAIAVVDSGRVILSNAIISQALQHNRFGGVVPELASRYHIEAIIGVLKEALSQACCSLADIDVLAVATGPGLIGSLLVGIQTAKALAWALNKPLVGVHHVEAHLYASMMKQDWESYMPAIGLVLSGGHSTLVQVLQVGEYRFIGQTVDDALGEAFDKVAKMLHLGYPGGPYVEQLASQGDPDAFPFRSGIVKGSPLSFSFSGIKTAVLYAIEQLARELTIEDKANICASFQKAVFQDVMKKLMLTCETFEPKALFLGGGVTLNKALRHLLQNLPVPVFWPSPDLCLDNGAMIAGLGYHVWKAQKKGFDIIEPKTRLEFYTSIETS